MGLIGCNELSQHVNVLDSTSSTGINCNSLSIYSLNLIVVFVLILYIRFNPQDNNGSVKFSDLQNFLRYNKPLMTVLRANALCSAR